MEGIILLADDDHDLRSIYAEILRREGFEVLEAADGREAVALAGRHRPRLMLLDVWMPVCNGFDVLDELRHHPDAASMSVVMLSNLDDAETRLESFSGGIRDYWVKGLPLDELLAKVRTILGSPSELGDLN